MSMKTDSDWDAFAGATFSRSAPTDLYRGMNDIQERTSDGLTALEKKIEDAEGKYQTIIKRTSHLGSLEEYFAEPLELLRLAVMELTDILGEMKNMGIREHHVQRLFRLGKQGAADMAYWEDIQPPQGGENLMAAIHDLHIDVVSLLSGVKVLGKIGQEMQAYIGCNLPQQKIALSPVKDANTREVRYQNIVTDLEAAMIWKEGEREKAQRFQGTSAVRFLWIYLLRHKGKNLKIADVEFHLKKHTDRAPHKFSKTVTNLKEKLARVAGVTQKEVGRWFEETPMTIGLKNLD